MDSANFDLGTKSVWMLLITLLGNLYIYVI